MVKNFPFSGPSTSYPDDSLLRQRHRMGWKLDSFFLVGLQKLSPLFHHLVVSRHPPSSILATLQIALKTHYHHHGITTILGTASVTTDTTTLMERSTLNDGFCQNLGVMMIFPDSAEGLWVTFQKACLLTAASIMI